MKAYVKNPAMSMAMERVTEALVANSGAIRIVDDIVEADLVVLHVIGYPETELLVKEIIARKQKYAIIQYCVRTTQRPSTLDWLEIWKNAECVWTYYDLEKMYLEDQIAMNEEKTGGASGMLFSLAQQGVKIYRSPLGVDPVSFRPWDVPKQYLIGTSGYVAESEGVVEANNATWALGGKQWHLGPELEGLKPNVKFQKGMNDKVLAQLYCQCKYVAGLRRGEGFELPAAEAILCGVRPVCFDQPHYRDWYKDWAVYIPEGTPEEVTEHLFAVLGQEPEPFTQEELDEAKALFSWPSIASGFWRSVVLSKSRSKSIKKRKLLWVGDAAVSTGFARSTHGVLETLKDYWDVVVLGINYHGDPHNFPYKIYPPRWAEKVNADMWGIARMGNLLEKEKPELVIIQQDPWNFPEYGKVKHNVPTVGVVAVDGLNCRGNDLAGLKKAIFWTEFGRNEAIKGGYKGLTGVVPLGVNQDVFRPMPVAEARRSLGLPDKLWDVFIVGNVNRNQPRKRFDLTMAYFAQWVHEYKIPDAFLFLHVAPTGDQGIDVQQFARYLGISNRLIIAEPEIGQGASEEILVRTYNSMNVAVSTTQGEGFGLTTLEAMACGVPFQGPLWSALGEWAAPAMHGVPCSEIACTPSNINAVGGIVDRDDFIQGLDNLYRDQNYRNEIAKKGYELASEDRFRWKNVGEAFHQELDEIFFTNSSITLSGAA